MQLIEETAFTTSMAGNAPNLFDAQQQHIAIAISTNAANFLKMARLLAFTPQALAGTRPLDGVARGDGLAQ